MRSFHPLLLLAVIPVILVHIPAIQWKYSIRRSQERQDIGLRRDAFLN